MSPEEKFHAILNDLEKHAGVDSGKMMSAPGIRFRNKNFAFFHKNEMVFRLGRDWNPSDAGIRNWSHFSPFKNKPPMVDWFCITDKDADLWSELATKALSRITSGK